MISQEPLPEVEPSVASHLPLPPRTTEQEDKTLAGQRKINLVWEYTQGFVTIIVVVTNMVVAATNAIVSTPGREHPVILSSALFLILGFYYSRTNHAAIGGVGPKLFSKYEGR